MVGVTDLIVIWPLTAWRERRRVPLRSLRLTGAEPMSLASRIVADKHQDDLPSIRHLFLSASTSILLRSASQPSRHTRMSEREPDGTAARDETPQQGWFPLGRATKNTGLTRKRRGKSAAGHLRAHSRHPFVCGCSGVGFHVAGDRPDDGKRCPRLAERQIMWNWLRNRARAEADILADLKALAFSVDNGEDWRCGRCSRMQLSGLRVWMPDGAQHWTSLSHVLRSAHSWNGESTAWCVRCAGRVLLLGDVQAEIQKIQEKRSRDRVERLTLQGEAAAQHPSQTHCDECDGQAGYIFGFHATIGAAHQAVMCPRCGWAGWERIPGNSGLTMTIR